jgi:hypothetical protein
MNPAASWPHKFLPVVFKSSMLAMKLALLDNREITS